MTGTTSQGPGNSGGTDSKTCLVFFRASAGVAFQPCLCDAHIVRFHRLSACYLYSILDLKLDNVKK